VQSTSPQIIHWASYASSGALIAYAAWRYIRCLREKPIFERSDLVYQEWFASGCSQLNVLTKLGGGRNCVRLVVTKTILWVTTWFPFSLIGPLYDMEHVVPLGSITSVRTGRFLLTTGLLVTFTLKNGTNRTLLLSS